MTQEFLKGSFTAKPKITQSIVSDGVSGAFELDMSNSGYGNLNMPALMTNTLIFTDPTIPGGFDASALPTADIQITGGRYTYTGAAQWGATGFTQGAYSYWGGGGFDVDSVDWSAYRNDAENPLVYSSGGTQTRKEAGNTCKTAPAGSGGC